jgi:hypothetical protein
MDSSRKLWGVAGFTHGRDQKGIQNFSRKAWKKEASWEKGVEGRILFKWRGVDSSGPEI